MKLTLMAIMLSLMTLMSCSSKKPEKKAILYPRESPEVTTTNPKGTTITAKQVATEQQGSLVTELKFKKGETTLLGSEEEKIKTLFERARAMGKIDEVQLITWGDQEFPDRDKKELNKKQRALVEKRNEYLENYLEGLDEDLEIKKISMAKRAGALQKFTATEEAQVKDSLEAKDAPNKASESMIVFVLEDD